MPPIVKAESAWEKVYNLPFEFINNFIEDLQCWNWELIGDRLSFPLGIACNFILFLFAIGRINDTDSQPTSEAFTLSQFLELSSISKLLVLLEVFIVLFSLLNWLNLFLFKFTHYQLFLAKIDDLEIFLNKHTELKPVFDRLPWWGDRWWGKWLYNLVKEHLPKSGPEIIHLRVWNFSKFQLNLACLLSPANIFIHYFFTYTNWYFLCFLNFGIISQNLLLKNSFLQLLKDKELIHSQLINEYNVKFVNNLFKKTETKSCQTDYNDFINGEIDKELDKRREQIQKEPCEHMVSATKFKSKSPLNPFQTGRYYPNI